LLTPARRNAHRRSISNLFNPPAATGGNLLKGLPVAGHRRAIPQIGAVFGKDHHARDRDKLLRGKPLGLAGTQIRFVAYKRAHADNIRGWLSQTRPRGGGGLVDVAATLACFPEKTWASAISRLRSLPLAALAASLAARSGPLAGGRPRRRNVQRKGRRFDLV